MAEIRSDRRKAEQQFLLLSVVFSDASAEEELPVRIEEEAHVASGFEQAL